MTKRLIITDIEGTITDINFVKETLFVYAHRHIDGFLRQHAEDVVVKAFLQDIKGVMQQSSVNLDSIIAQCLCWIEQDKKITPLKAIQGLIWQQAYQKGDIKGHLYADAVDFLKQQHQLGVPIFVYSSGSVQAQQLLFEYSIYGDLRYLFSGYFDTHVGHKQLVTSYIEIEKQLPSGYEVWFLSDVAQELNCAQQAGMQTLHLVRNGQNIEQHRAIANFKHFMWE